MKNNAFPNCSTRWMLLAAANYSRSARFTLRQSAAEATVTLSHVKRWWSGTGTSPARTFIYVI